MRHCSGVTSATAAIRAHTETAASLAVARFRLQGGPLDLGLASSSLLVVGPELDAASHRDRHASAEQRLNQFLSRETFESDALTRQALDVAVRGERLDVARTLPLQGGRGGVRFTWTNGGTIDSVGVLRSPGLPRS